jgi:hypothetical protein
MRIDATVDERMDPSLDGAAAQLLKFNDLPEPSRWR